MQLFTSNLKLFLRRCINASPDCCRLILHTICSTRSRKLKSASGHCAFCLTETWDYFKAAIRGQLLFFLFVCTKRKCSQEKRVEKSAANSSPLVCQLSNYKTSLVTFRFPNNCFPKLNYYSLTESYVHNGRRTNEPKPSWEMTQKINTDNLLSFS